MPKKKTKKKSVRRQLVPRTRNAGTWTEAAYWGAIRSHLRRGFRYWKPIMKTKLAARRPYEGPNKRQKWESQCAHCKEWFKDKDTQVDHIIPVGSLKCPGDLVGFLERLTCEEGFQVLCTGCHQIKTNEERGK